MNTAAAVAGLVAGQEQGQVSYFLVGTESFHRNHLAHAVNRTSDQSYLVFSRTMIRP